MQSALCRICQSSRLEPAVDLGNQPWANHYLQPDEVGKEPKYPLRLVWCADCRAAQLDYTVPKEVMFSDHTYLSGMTDSLSGHFRAVAEEVDQRFFAGASGKSVLDIGSNDGTQLRQFRELGYDVLGIESSSTPVRIAQDQGIPTVRAFFNHSVARELGRRFHVVNAAGVLFHLEELHSACDGIRECLREEGVFVVQFLYAKQVLANLAFDQIYHEHLLYYNLATLQPLLAQHGMELFDAYQSPIHGGSIIGFVSHEAAVRGQRSERLQSLLRREELSEANELATYRRFARQIEQRRCRDLDYLNQSRARGKKVFGMGAPVKGNTLLNYFGVGPELIELLVEKNRLRHGLFSPGMHLPVIHEDQIRQQPNIYYVLAWNFREEILRRHEHLRDAGVEFYFPIEPTAD